MKTLKFRGENTIKISQNFLGNTLFAIKCQYLYYPKDNQDRGEDTKISW